MTDANANHREHRYLLMATIGNLAIGCVGIVASVISSSQAILLDGLFNITYFIVGIFTLKVASLIQPGRTRMVLAHVVLPQDFRVESLTGLDGLRATTLQRLQGMHPATVLEMVFTADPVWGAPATANE